MVEVSSERLKYLYHEKDLTQREIAQKLGVSQPAISKEMSQEGLKSNYSGFWSEDEERILENHYSSAPKEELLSRLEDRSWEAIKLKAMDLGVAKSAEEYRNSEEVAERLRRNAQRSKCCVNFEEKSTLSYVLGVIDGDGFYDNEGTIGLETKSSKFIDKFFSRLRSIGLNPNKGYRREVNTLWASSIDLVNWVESLDFYRKERWLENEGDIWKYLEGAYDSDGDFSNPGPRICSYDEEEKQFLKRLMEDKGLEPSIHSNNVYVPVRNREKFFQNVQPVYERRRP